MAKRKYSGLSSKSFFNIVVLSVAAIGLMVTTFALQNKTTSQSNASACNSDPKLVLLNSEGAKYGVTYHLKLINTCDGAKDFKVTVDKEPYEGSEHGDWMWKFAAEDNFRSPRIKQNVTSKGSEVNITIKRPCKNNVGQMGIEECALDKNLKPGVRYFTLKASLVGNSNISDTLTIPYNVEK